MGSSLVVDVEVGEELFAEWIGDASDCVVPVCCAVLSVRF